MLKPADPGPQPERPIGELVHELIEEGKGYARAEIGLAKAVAIAKGRALVFPSAILFVALLVAQSAVTALAAGVVLALAKFIGPLAAGVVGLLIFAILAAAIGWYGVQRFRRAL
jgi:hypothetical protein